jgi:crossover junction endodeoxyribonuclease RuvC
VRVIGIDPGTQRAGYGVLDAEGQRLRLVECGAAAAPRGAPVPERLAAIYAKLAEVVGRTRPEHGAVEEVFYDKSVRSAITIGEARGVALLALAQAGVAVSEFTPAEVKRAVTGNGRAGKHQVAAMVARLLALERPPEPADAADALACAICFAHRARGGSAP